MRPSWQRRAGGSFLLAATGALSLFAPLPQAVLAGSVTTCLREAAGTATLGLHLGILRTSTDCPHGSYAPGPHLMEYGSISISMSMTAILVGLIAFTSAVGIRWWIARTAHAVATWFARHLRVFHAVRAPIALPRLRAYSFVSDLRGILFTRVPRRRGPPAFAAS